MIGGLILPPSTLSGWKELIEKELKVVRDEPASPQKDLAIDQLQSFYQLILDAERDTPKLSAELLAKLIALLN